MAESGNRHINGVDNGWFGDCDTVSVVINYTNSFFILFAHK